MKSKIIQLLFLGTVVCGGSSALAVYDDVEVYGVLRTHNLINTDLNCQIDGEDNDFSAKLSTEFDGSQRDFFLELTDTTLSIFFISDALIEKNGFAAHILNDKGITESVVLCSQPGKNITITAQKARNILAVSGLLNPGGGDDGEDGYYPEMD